MPNLWLILLCLGIIIVPTIIICLFAYLMARMTK